ncbi:MAG: hypothetical protein LBQ60_05330 [Bacteroidales bacterium]|nr:hypothetical protein [Bacteroidales bacterium]
MMRIELTHTILSNGRSTIEVTLLYGTRCILKNKATSEKRLYPALPSELHFRYFCKTGSDGNRTRDPGSGSAK